MSQLQTYPKQPTSMQSSYALARRAEQNYRDMINQQLIHSLERMANPNYQAQDMPNDFHASVLNRIAQQMEQADVQDTIWPILWTGIGANPD